MVPHRYSLLSLLCIGLAGPSAAAQPTPLVPKQVEVRTGAGAVLKDALFRVGSTQLRHGSRILTLAYTPDSALLAAGGGNDPVRIWHATQRTVQRTLPETWVHALAFSANGVYLATGGGFKHVRLWEIGTGREIQVMKGHDATVQAAVFAPAGNLLATAGQDRSIILWEIPTGRQLHKLQGHTDEINCLAIAPDGKTLLSGGLDRTLRLWSLPDGQPQKTLETGAAVHALAFGSDGKTFFSGGDDQQIRLWELGTGKESKRWQGHASAVTALTLLPGGQKLASAGRDTTMRIWSLPDGKEEQTITRTLGDADAFALAPDGKTVAAAGQNNCIRQWTVATGAELNGEPTSGAQTAVVSGADGKSLITATSAGAIHIWDVTTGTQRRTWPAHAGGLLFLALSPDGKQLASACAAEPIKIWDVESGAEKLALPASGVVQALRFAPDGSLGAAYRETGVRLWDLNTKQARLLPTPSGIQALAFAPTGRLLATASSEQVSLWDIATGLIKHNLGKGLPAASLAFAPDGLLLAAGGHDGVIRLWDVELGKELRICEGHQSVVYDLAFAPGGRLLASGSFDHHVRLWEVVSGSSIADWTGHDGCVHSVAFAPDGMTVYSGSADTTTLCWDATGMRQNGRLAKQEITGRAEELWNKLAVESPSEGYRTVWTLLASGEPGMALLKERIYLLDRDKLEKHIADLNATKYVVREKASVALAGYGRWIEGRLAESLQNPPSLEVKMRVETLLEKLKDAKSISLAQERLRAHRVLEVLEQLATPAAVAQLRAMASGAPEISIARGAQQSLQRLKQRGVAVP